MKTIFEVLLENPGCSFFMDEDRNEYYFNLEGNLRLNGSNKMVVHKELFPLVSIKGLSPIKKFKLYKAKYKYAKTSGEVAVTKEYFRSKVIAEGFLGENFFSWPVLDGDYFVSQSGHEIKHPEFDSVCGGGDCYGC